MKLLEMLVDCSLTGVTVFLIFPAAVGVAASSPVVVAAFAGAGLMMAIYGE
jgi:hypothetical protein